MHKADPEITELIKWGAPYFEDHGRVAWMFAASEWVNFSLHNAALIKDTYKLFEPTENQAMRTIKLREGQAIPEEEIIEYVKEIVANNRVGKKVVFEKAPKVEIELPHDVAIELKSAHLEDKYWARPYYQQKGYLQWLDQAKHQETREKRIRTMLGELHNGTYMPPKHERSA